MALELYRELAQWLMDRVDDGMLPDVMSRMLDEQRYTEGQVDELLALAYDDTEGLRHYLAHFEENHEAAQQAAKRALFQPVAQIDIGHRNGINEEHGLIRMGARSYRPYVVVLENFLTADECDQVIAISQNNTKRALVIDRKTGEDELDRRRTSHNVIFDVHQHPVLRTVENRIARVTGVPVENTEGIQVMHYGVGAEYQPHQDFFSPDVTGEALHLDNGGNRIATLIIYLNDVEEGGGTTFPHAGFDVYPQKGSAVFFSYTDASGANDVLAFHGGLPVVKGEKWIASKWMRERATPWGEKIHPDDKANVVVVKGKKKPVTLKPDVAN